MAKFNGYVLTEKGRELLAKGLGGGKIEFTKMQIGDGTTTTDARNMTALVNPKKDLTILNINVTGGQCELTALLSNQNLNTGFYIKELGVFARGTDGIEILYAYNVSINPDFIPPFNANNIVEIEYVDTLIVDQAANVTAVIDPNITYITKQMADKTYLEKIKWLETIGGQFGGYVSKVASKEAGKLYINDVYDNKLYVCVTAHSSTSFDITKYRDITNNGISNKLKNLSEIRVLKNTEIENRLSLYFEGCALTKIGNIVIFNGYMKKNYNTYINVAGTVLFTFPYRPLSETWVEPFFTIRQNGDFEVGAHGAFNTNKITEPRHINFVYVCQN